MSAASISDRGEATVIMPHHCRRINRIERAGVVDADRPVRRDMLHLKVATRHRDPKCPPRRRHRFDHRGVKPVAHIGYERRVEAAVWIQTQRFPTLTPLYVIRAPPT